MIENLIAVAKEIHAQKYPQSEVMFLAGSLIRGEGTATSDLDIVVVFRKLECAYRESYRFDKWPVEAFIHDPETLKYFFQDVDGALGVPILPTMVSEGIEIPKPNEFSRSMKELAKSVLALGPPGWGELEVDNSRYMITNLLDDLQDSRSRAEQIASATVLFEQLSVHFLRSRQLWSAKGKAIPRRLREVDAAFASRFEHSFHELFASGDASQVIGLAESVLERDGGRLFENYSLPASPGWRRSL